MEDLNKKEVISILNKIMQYELAGVVRYTHYSLMVTGRDRLSLTAFFKEQATESLLHATIFYFTKLQMAKNKRVKFQRIF